MTFRLDPDCGRYEIRIEKDNIVINGMSRDDDPILPNSDFESMLNTVLDTQDAKIIPGDEVIYISRGNGVNTSISTVGLFIECSSKVKVKPKGSEMTSLLSNEYIEELRDAIKSKVYFLGDSEFVIRESSDEIKSLSPSRPLNDYKSPVDLTNMMVDLTINNNPQKGFIGFRTYTLVGPDWEYQWDKYSGHFTYKKYLETKYGSPIDLNNLIDLTEQHIHLCLK